jgi:glycosyltransferase involved in cell wall biosynthesis
VRHGTTGLLAGDFEEFTRYLAWVLLNRHLRERLGQAARAHAARFTWPQTAAAFARVLDEVVAPAGRLAERPPEVPEEPAAGRAAV